MSLILLPLLKIVVIVFGFAVFLGVFLSFEERKKSALLQGRMGSRRTPAGSTQVHGLMRFFADSVKALFKEDFTPAGVHKALHALAPALGLFSAMVVFAIIPFGDYWCSGGTTAVVGGMDYCLPAAGQWSAGSSWSLERLQDPLFNGRLGHYFQIVDLDSGLLYMFAVTSLSVFGAALAGWASNAKYSVLGALRACSQMISFRAAMGFALVGPLMIYGTLDLNEMVRSQGDLLFGFLPMWGVLVQPLAFAIFLVASLAESKRAPFNTHGAEAEIFAGHFKEYSSAKLAAFSLGEFVTLGFVGAIGATLFLGGWQVPWLYADGFHFSASGMLEAGATLSGSAVEHYVAGGSYGPDIALPSFVVAFLRVGSLVLKTLLVCFLLFRMRWTVLRFRYDQIMRLGWKVLLPLSFVNLVITSLVVLFLN